MRFCIVDPPLSILTLEARDAVDSAIVSQDTLRLFQGYASWRLRAARALLTATSMARYAPARLTAAALRLASPELFEVFLACDPDCVDARHVRWGRALTSVLRRRYPQWAYLDEANSWSVRPSPWRRYDPSATVSIVLPTYNGSRYLPQALESCLGQSHRRLEVIVVDDGSDQDIAGLVARYTDRRLRYIRHPENRGMAEALNTGFRESTGNYLTWTSDDNEYAARAVEEMVGFLQTYPDVEFVYTDQVVLEEATNGTVIPGLRRARPVTWLSVDNGVGACFLYTRRVYETIGAYDPRAFLVEDYDYWLRVSRRFRMQRLFKPLYYYRYHPHALSSRYTRREIAARVWAIRRRHGLRPARWWRREQGVSR